MMKKLLYIACGLIGVVVIVLIAAYMFIDANKFRPAIEAQLSSSLGRKVQVGDLGLSLFSGGISARDISIADDPAFSRAPFLTAKSVDVSVELVPLFLSRTVRLTALTLKEPDIALLRSSSGKWNFSSLGSATVATPALTQRKLAIQRLRIVNGRVTVASWLARDEPTQYESVNMTARDVSYESQIPFTMAAKTPGGGEVKAEGTLGPINRADVSEAPLTANVTLQAIDFADTGLSGSSAAGLLDFAGSVKSDGKQAHTEGTVKVTKLQLARNGGPAKVQVVVDYATDYDLVQQAGVLSRGEIHIGQSIAHLSGTYDLQGQSTVVHLKLAGAALPLADVEELLPALGVALPTGASLQGGTVDTDLVIEGPVHRIVTTGRLNLSNSRLTGFDLASKLSALSALAGLKGGADTAIQMLSSNLRIAPEGVRADNMRLIVPSIGTMTGRGTIGTDNALDFHMVAMLANPGQGTALGQMASRFPVLGQNTKNGNLPFMVQGTSSSPVFLPDVAGMVSSGLDASLLSTQPAAQQIFSGRLDGLLGKKQ